MENSGGWGMLGPLSPPPSTIGSVRMSFVPYGWLLSQNRPIYKSTSTIAITEAIKPSYLSPYKPDSPTKSRRISNNQQTNQDRRDSISCPMPSCRWMMLILRSIWFAMDQVHTPIWHTNCQQKMLSSPPRGIPRW